MTMGKTPDEILSYPYIEGVNAFINFLRCKGYDDALTYEVVHLQIITLVG